jgi:hypothetical protein
MQASSELHAPVGIHRGKEPSVPFEQEGRRAPEPVWTRWQGEKIPAPAENRTLVVQPVA